jgi:hypothetical protein
MEIGAKIYEMEMHAHQNDELEYVIISKLKYSENLQKKLRFWLYAKSFISVAEP